MKHKRCRIINCKKEVYGKSRCCRIHQAGHQEDVDRDEAYKKEQGDKWQDYKSKDRS